MKKDFNVRATFAYEGAAATKGEVSADDLGRAPTDREQRSSPAEEEGRDVQARFLFGVNRSSIVA